MHPSIVASREHVAKSILRTKKQLSVGPAEKGRPHAVSTRAYWATERDILQRLQEIYDQTPA